MNRIRDQVGIPWRAETVDQIEWELVEYVRDSITAGNKKALILLGHMVSEQGGMIYCAEWLRSFIP